MGGDWCELPTGVPFTTDRALKSVRTYFLGGRGAKVLLCSTSQVASAYREPLLVSAMCTGNITVRGFCPWPFALSRWGGCFALIVSFLRIDSQNTQPSSGFFTRAFQRPGEMRIWKVNSRGRVFLLSEACFAPSSACRPSPSRTLKSLYILYLVLMLIWHRDCHSVTREPFDPH